ncbi:MAG TPA: Vms1/Ankzf1 family peptidyl-tRNA hydrolase [Thermoleophilaceae bacterium]|jgi:peptide subunit release factor 1 (eRF1)
MQTNQLDRSKLRELADLRAEGAKVLSLYLNLDPTEFANSQARSTEMSSLLDEADRRLRDGDSLSHDEKVHLREDVERVREYFKGPDFSAKGAHGLAIFCSGPVDLFEVIKLPRPVDTGVALGDSPFIEPLADLAFTDSWGVFLVSRKMARILRGSRDGLEEIARISDDVHGWHDQGGWSQARYQRGIQKEADDHVKHAADTLFRRFRRAPFDRLLIGCPEEHCGEVEKRLHPYLRERIVGRIDVDVENTSPDEVLKAASGQMEEEDSRREREALDRLEQGLGTGGRGAAGLDEVLGVLNERRVEILMFEQGLSAPGVTCPACGWVGAEGSTCPVDGTELDQRADIIETAVQLAITQSAEVIPVHHHEDLDGRGSIAAVLRF